ncbi:hypothetical protein POM88_022606 [Heracleum sosnowskyi]|uniref:Uncharacterized protein n=1 Tax=Heracleum sosnowskyi TaxID=360622 RepID=A0AAD8MTR1_9APIA|nr:hypothetical protein POM88_022606 [Heracleum sosnowskyi]
MGIRKVLHPVRIADTNKFEYRAANFDMTKKEKESFCSVFFNAKLPHGTASNISRCVQIDERKIFGYKSHDAHFMLQYLLQFAAVKTLKPEAKKDGENAEESDDEDEEMVELDLADDDEDDEDEENGEDQVDSDDDEAAADGNEAATW